MATVDSRNDADVLFLPEDDAVATNSSGNVPLSVYYLCNWGLEK